MAYRSRYSGSYGRRRSRRGFLGWLAALAALTAGALGAWWAGWFDGLRGIVGRTEAVSPRATAAPGPAAAATPGASGTVAPGVAPAGTAATAATPAPPPDNTPGVVGRRYLTAWQAGDFAAMYATLAAPAQARISREAFINRYEAIKEEAGITKVTVTPAAGIPDNATSLPYQVVIETRVGAVSEQQVLPLIQAEGRWGVDWQPTLIFKELKGERLVRFFPDNPVRGRILDRHGTVLAEMGEAPLVGVIPAEIKDEGALLAGLSQKLGMEAAAIKKRYSGGRPDWFMPIKRLSWRTEEPELVAIQRLAEGIQVRMVPERTYPENHLAAHIVGYVTEVQAEDLPKGYQAGDRVGRSGIEAAAEKELAGERGGRLMIVEKDGSPAVTLAQRKAKPGADVTLSLDLTIQRVAEAALGEKRGAVVVMDPKDGAVLALVSKPSFDPNAFVLGFSDEAWAQLNDPKLRPLTNRAVDGVYPPGSIFKVVTMATGMEKLGMPRGEQFSCAGSFKLPKAPQVWADWKPGGHGRLNLVQGLSTSCDIVFYTIGQKADAVTGDATLLAEMARAFGLGQPTGMAELPDAAGNVPDEAWKMKTFNDVWATGDTINFAIGQGFLLVTPLQMAVIYTAIANGGTLWTPYLIQRVTLPGGPDIRTAEPKERGRLPIQPPTLAAIKDGLNAVPTALGGTGYLAFKDYTGPPAAGKTGTAETGVKGVTHAWFASYCPQVDPKLVVITLVEEGKDAEGEGSRAAAPIARAIFEKVLPGGPSQPAPAPKPAATPAPAAKPAPTAAAKPAATPTRKP
jgi:penicillin-binding protein 2